MKRKREAQDKPWTLTDVRGNGEGVIKKRAHSGIGVIEKISPNTGIKKRHGFVYNTSNTGFTLQEH